MKASRPVVTSAGHISGMNTLTGDDDPGAGAVDDCGFLDLDRQVAHEGGQHPDRERQGEDQVGDHQRRASVLYRPSQRISSNMPDSTATCGNIDTPRMVSSSSAAPAEADAAQREGGRHAQQERHAHRQRWPPAPS